MFLEEMLLLILSAQSCPDTNNICTFKRLQTLGLVLVNISGNVGKKKSRIFVIYSWNQAVDSQQHTTKCYSTHTSTSLSQMNGPTQASLPFYIGTSSLLRWKFWKSSPLSLEWNAPVHTAQMPLQMTTSLMSMNDPWEAFLRLLFWILPDMLTISAQRHVSVSFTNISCSWSTLCRYAFKISKGYISVILL